MVKIVRDTPSETIIEDRPWILGLILASATVGSAALLFHAVDISSFGLALAAGFLGFIGISDVEVIAADRLGADAEAALAAAGAQVDALGLAA